MSEIVVNDVVTTIPDGPPRSLLYVLREELGLTGPKYGCGEGECGTCSVLIDGKLRRSCVVGVEEAAGKAVTTIEGLSQKGRLHALQHAFAEVGAFQCGYCTPGMIVAASALLAEDANPSEARIKQALEGNVCRCGAHAR